MTQCGAGVGLSQPQPRTGADLTQRGEEVDVVIAQPELRQLAAKASFVGIPVSQEVH